MRPKAEYWKVEEHEPVNSRLWVEMSPPPTRLDRRDAEMNGSYEGIPFAIVRCTRMLAGRGHGENVARPWNPHRLAASKDKDCDRRPNQYV